MKEEHNVQYSLEFKNKAKGGFWYDPQTGQPLCKDLYALMVLVSTKGIR